MDYTTELVQHDGKLFYKTDSGLTEASLTDVVKTYRTMQYNLMTCMSFWATDRPDLVIDPEGLLVKLQYIEIPENVIRIK